jgi:hypothetical protein
MKDNALAKAGWKMASGFLAWELGEAILRNKTKKEILNQEDNTENMFDKRIRRDSNKY